MSLDFELFEDRDGTKHAANACLSVSILPDGESKFFHRRAMKMDGQKDSMLVAELDGVRVYIKDNAVILTKQDLYLCLSGAKV